MLQVGLLNPIFIHWSRFIARLRVFICKSFIHADVVIKRFPQTSMNFHVLFFLRKKSLQSRDTASEWTGPGLLFVGQSVRFFFADFDLQVFRKTQKSPKRYNAAIVVLIRSFLFYAFRFLWSFTCTASVIIDPVILPFPSYAYVHIWFMHCPSLVLKLKPLHGNIGKFFRLKENKCAEKLW